MFDGEGLLHGVEVGPLVVDVALDAVEVDGFAAVAFLALGVFGEWCAVGSGVNAEALAVVDLVEREEAAANGELDEVDAFGGLAFPAGRTGAEEDEEFEAAGFAGGLDFSDEIIGVGDGERGGVGDVVARDDAHDIFLALAFAGGGS